MSKFQKNLTEGSVTENLIKFCLPFLFSNVIQSFYSVADLFIVSRFNGPESIAGVNIGSQITMFVTNLVLGLVTGGTILLAQYIGADRNKDVKDTIGTMFSIMTIIAVFMTCSMVIFSDFFLRLLNTPPEAYSEAKSYLVICMCGTVFIFGYNVISATLRSMGDSKNPLLFVSIACVINVILDYILIGVFDLKAAGAAYATIFSQAVSMIVSVIYLMRRDFVFEFKLSNFRIHPEKMKLLLKIGLPTSIQNSISSLSFMTMSMLVNTIGVTAAAGTGIVGKINGFAILPSIGMSMSVSAMAGQNIGAGFYDRAKKTMYVGIRIAFGIGASIFVLIQLFPEGVIRIFTKDAETISYGITYIRAFSFDYLIVPFAFCASGLVTGSGHTLYTALTTILTSLLLRMPFAYILGTVFGLGVFGIGLAVPISSLGAVIMYFSFIRTGKWKTKRIIQTLPEEQVVMQ